MCNLDRFNGYSIRPPPSTSTLVLTDASRFAFKGFSTCLGDSVVREMWTPKEAAQSSMLSELKAILFVLAHTQPSLSLKG